jgi:hypothetical protein
MPNKDQYPVLVAEILHEKDDPPSTLLYDTKRETGYLVEGLASRLCKSFNGRFNLQQAINLWAKETNSSESDYRSEINTFLDNLEEQGLIKWLEKSLTD